MKKLWSFLAGLFLAASAVADGFTPSVTPVYGGVLIFSNPSNQINGIFTSSVTNDVFTNVLYVTNFTANTATIYLGGTSLGGTVWTFATSPAGLALSGTGGILTLGTSTQSTTIASNLTVNASATVATNLTVGGAISVAGFAQIGTGSPAPSAARPLTITVPAENYWATNQVSSGSYGVWYDSLQLTLGNNTDTGAVVSRLSEVDFLGTGSPISGSHGVGLKGLAKNLSTGVLPLMIGTEGSVDNSAAGTVITADAFQAQFANNDGIIGLMAGLDAKIPASFNSGTVTNLAVIHVPNIGTIAGVQNEYSYFVEDRRMQTWSAGPANFSGYYGNFSGNNLYFGNTIYSTNGSSGAYKFINSAGSGATWAQYSSSDNLTMGNSSAGYTSLQSVNGQVFIDTGSGSGVSHSAIFNPGGSTEVTGTFFADSGVYIGNTFGVNIYDSGGIAALAMKVTSSATNATLIQSGLGTFQIGSAFNQLQLGTGANGTLTNWITVTTGGTTRIGGSVVASNDITAGTSITSFSSFIGTNGAAFKMYGLEGSTVSMLALSSSTNVILENSANTSTYTINLSGSITEATGGITRRTVGNNGTMTFATNVIFNGLVTVNTNLIVTNLVGGSGVRIGVGTNAVGVWGTGSLVASINTNGLFTGSAAVNHLIGSGSAPAIAAGAGAGTSPTVSIVGTDLGGTITVTSGTLPSISSVIVTVTFAVPFGTTSYPLIWPSNAAAATLGFNPYVSGGASTFTVNAGTVALGGATTYTYNYMVSGL